MTIDYNLLMQLERIITGADVHKVRHHLAVYTMCCQLIAEGDCEDKYYYHRERSERILVKYLTKRSLGKKCDIRRCERVIDRAMSWECVCKLCGKSRRVNRLTMDEKCICQKGENK